jgi:glycosyltransferase involved in cell wall biosynthesis
VCAGEGDRVGVARYAERLGIADAVKFTGWVGPSGKRALLEAAAVFALPSYDEALPVSLIEAMSAGVPPVVSPVGGIPEIVQEGISGVFVAPGDKAGLERRLKRLLLDRALAERIGAAARESARLRFAPERILARLEEIYAAAGVTRIGATELPQAATLKKAA